MMCSPLALSVFYQMSGEAENPKAGGEEQKGTGASSSADEIKETTI